MENERNIAEEISGQTHSLELAHKGENLEFMVASFATTEDERFVVDYDPRFVKLREISCGEEESKAVVRIYLRKGKVN